MWELKRDCQCRKQALCFPLEISGEPFVHQYPAPLACSSACAEARGPPGLPHSVSGLSAELSDKYVKKCCCWKMNSYYKPVSQIASCQ